MARLQLSIDINSEQETVFDVVTDFENSPQRIAWYEAVDMLTDGPVGVGTKWRETRVMNNRRSFEDWEVVSFERPNYFSAHCESQGYDVDYTMRVNPTGTGSQLSILMTTRPQTLMGKFLTPIEWLMSGMMKKIVQKDLESTKNYIELSATVSTIEK